MYSSLSLTPRMRPCWAGEPGREQGSICEHRQGVGGPADCCVPLTPSGGRRRQKQIENSFQSLSPEHSFPTE